MNKLHLIAGLSAVAIAVSGCAAFTANPTPAQCVTAQNQLKAANTALAVAELSLANAKAAGADAAKIAQIETDVSIVQSDVAFFQSLIDQNCPAPKPTV